MDVSAHPNETEIIDFLQPLESEKNLYVTNIVVRLPEEDALPFVQAALVKAFSRFGLLYGVMPFIGHNFSQVFHPLDKDNAGDKAVSCQTSCLYAFVKFYSKLCARKAKQLLHLTKIVGSQPCKIQFSQRKKSAGRQKEALYPGECFDVANFYLGFDGWSTAIKLMKREDPAADVEDIDQGPDRTVCRFVCVVELTVYRHGVTSHGIGTAQEPMDKDVMSKGSVFKVCRKRAQREAIRNAFSRLLLVVLGTRKVYVDIDSSVADPLKGMENLRDPNLLTMNELLEEPKDSSDEEEEQEQIEDILDAQTINILVDLESEND